MLTAIAGKQSKSITPNNWRKQTVNKTGTRTEKTANILLVAR